MIHLPLLRQGRPYKSMDVLTASHYRTGEAVAEISQANVGLIRRDMLNLGAAREALAGWSARSLIDLCREAGEQFLHAELALGDGAQTPDDYVRQLSATTGMPNVLVRRNMTKIHSMFVNMEAVLKGLTRGMDLRVLDEGYAGESNPMSFFPRGDSLGVVLPSNSPGVHSLWIPSIALKTPLVLKPGSAEPWTPWRIIQAFIKAGAPAEAFSFYPTDHGGANEILRMCGRGMLFGDVGAVKGWARDPRIELHGPGYSKIVFGEDLAGGWEQYAGLMVDSIAGNGGRSCVNASGVWTPSHGDEIAEGLAERMAKIAPRAEDDPEAGIAPFANPAVARRVDQMIEQGLAEGGAEDVTARVRGTARLQEWQGCTYLLPTVIRCDSPDHPLANREFLFPFASVVEAPNGEMPGVLGPTLVASVISGDAALRRRMLTSPLVGRLNLGAIPTNVIDWDQPHEGNLFDHLYARRAIAMRLESVSGHR